MADHLVLTISGETCLSIARSDGVPGQLRSLLERLDADMDEGIELDGAPIAAPDRVQRCHYVLGELLAAITADKPALARSLLIYLSLHWPQLRAIEVHETATDWTVELDQEPA